MAATAVGFEASKQSLAVGLKEYRDELEQVKQLSVEGSASESTFCRTNTFVQALLALFATAGAVALLVLSGGPTDLNLFVPGCLLGVFAVGATIALVYTAVQSVREQQASHQAQIEVSVAVNSPLGEFLPEMLKALPEENRKVLDGWTSPKRVEFASALYSEFFATGAPALDENQKKLLAVCGSFKDIPRDLDFAGKSREFVYALVGGAETHLNETSDTALANELAIKFQRALGPLSKEESEGLAAYHAFRNHRPFALEILRELPEEYDVEVRKKLFSTVASPRSADEANILASYPAPLVAFIDGKERSYALDLLKHFTPEAPAAILNKLFEKVGAPQSPEEVDLLNRHSKLLHARIVSQGNDYAVEVFKHLPEASKRPYAEAVLNLVPAADANPQLLQTLVGVLNPVASKEVAMTLCNHPKAIDSVLAQPGDESRDFALNMIGHLPSSSEHLKKFYQKVGPARSEDEAAILAAHSKTCIEFTQNASQAAALLDHLQVEQNHAEVLDHAFKLVGVPTTTAMANRMVSSYPEALVRHIEQGGNPVIIPMLNYASMPLTQVQEAIEKKVQLPTGKAAREEIAHLPPHVLVRLIQIAQRKFANEAAAFFTLMTSKEQSAFLKQLRESVAGAKGQVSDNLKNVAQRCIASLLTPLFLQFVKDNNVAGPTTLQSEAGELLVEVSKWPTAVANALYADVNSLDQDTSFVNLLLSFMEPAEKDECVKGITARVQAWRKKEVVAEKYRGWLQSTLPLTPAQREVMKNTPNQMAAAMILLTVDQQAGLATALGIYQEMDETLKQGLHGFYVNELKTMPNPEARANFIKKLIEVCQVGDFTAQRLIEFFKDFLKTNQGALRTFLLDVEDETPLALIDKSDQLAIEILEAMGLGAKDVIKSELDATANGWKNFNRLTQKLRVQIPPNEEVPPSRQVLMRYFYDMRGTYALVGKNALDMKDDPENKVSPTWEMFAKIALANMTPPPSPMKPRPGPGTPIPQRTQSVVGLERVGAPPALARSMSVPSPAAATAASVLAQGTPQPGTLAKPAATAGTPQPTPAKPVAAAGTPQPTPAKPAATATPLGTPAAAEKK